MSTNDDWTNQVQNQVIVAGANGGVFVYDPAPGFGNLIASITDAAEDPYGNATLKGVTTYFHGGNWFALQHHAGEIDGYTATTAAGPWSQVSALSFSTQLEGAFVIEPSVEIAVDVWNTAVLVNSWTGSGSATNGLFYKLTPFNEVHLIGDVSSPGTASLMTTLPLGYRPASGINVEFNRYDDSGTAHALVGTDGTVTMETVVGVGHGLFCNAIFPLASL